MLKKDKKIIFQSLLADSIDKPKPALQFIPEVYKKLDRQMSGQHKKTNQTIKACVPFLDAYKSGYILPFQIDYDVYYYDGRLNFDASNILSGAQEAEALKNFKIDFHANEQVPEELRHDKRTVEAVFKFINPWTIITPPGYSCLFTQPLNQNAPFKIIDGVVDTDKYHNRVHFPFYWTGDINKRYLLKHGTPMVQVIPFKRDDWKMEVSKEDAFNEKYWFSLARRLVDGYRQTAWSKKNYK